MVRKLIPALVLLASHLPGNVLALGVGDIHLESALNQEFDGYIDLLSVKSDELDGVKIKLASPEAFERAGMDRPFILSKLRFSPEVGPQGKAVIRVNSREPIREPFLNFLIEVNWAKGRLVREYTVLLDPPVTLERKPAPVVQPTTTAPAPEQPRQKMVSEAPAAVRAEPATAAQSEYGPVQATDTLWNIAKTVKPQGTSVHQMMMALQRSNPHAFYKNNVNNLKKGVILRIPSREEIEFLSNAEAKVAFRDQVEEWRAGRSGETVAKTEVAEAPVPEVPESTAAPEPEVVQPESQLKLVSARPEGEGEVGASEGEDDAGRRAASLENSLALAQEEAASAKQENQELSSRLQALEEKLAEMERMQQLVTVRDEQLAALQAGAAEEEPEQVAEEATLEVEELQPAPSAEAEASAPEVAAPAPEPKRASSASIVDQILSLVEKNQTVAMGAGGGLLLLILLLLLLRRRKAGAEDFEESVLITPSETASAKEDVVAEMPEEEEGVGGETSLLSDFATSDMDALQEDTGEVDPVAEADVYIAYGRFQQAEELVNQAIEREPERLSLKHKLLEIHSAAGNSAAFTKLAEEMAAQGAEQADTAAWSKVLSMGAKLAPAHALFAGGLAAAGESSIEDTLEVSDSVDAELDELATELGIEEDTQAPDTAAQEAGDELSDLDLDLDFDDALQELESPAGEESAADSNLDLDFDLDLGGADAEEAPDLGEGLSLEQEEEGPGMGLSELSADDLMPEQLVEENELETPLPEAAVEELHSADDLAQELAGLATDLDLGDMAEPEGAEQDFAGLDEELSDLGGDLDLGSVESLGLGEGEPELGADLGAGDLAEELSGLDADLGDDLSAGGELDVDSLSEGLPDISSDLSLGEELKTDELDDALSGLTEGAGQQLDVEEDLEQTLSSLTEGLDLELDAETEDLEHTLSSLSGDLDLGDAADMDDLEQTLSGFSESVIRGDDGAEGGEEDLLADISTDELMSGTLGEESASTQLLDEALEEDEGADEVTTKLDLAKAYVEMGDAEGARSILEEVLGEGDDQQKVEAQGLIDQLS
ncbi:FimV/HubP family polar landmark protein [Pseudomonadota bacterium]